MEVRNHVGYSERCKNAVLVRLAPGGVAWGQIINDGNLTLWKSVVCFSSIKKFRLTETSQNQYREVQCVLTPCQ